MKPSLTVYRVINNLSWPTSYLGKFLFVSFIGIHIPLIGLIIYLLPKGEIFSQQLPIVLVALISTLIGAFITLWMLAKLLKPLTLTSKALRNYTENRKLPNLPTNYTDEAGSLMADTQRCIIQLDENMNLKNDLLSILSHDARSPINSIMLANQMIDAELKQENPDSAEVQELLSIIEISSNNQLELMNNILTLARLDSGDVIVDKENVPLDAIAERVKETNDLQLKAKNIDLEYELGEFKNRPIYIDEIKLKAVLNNLVQNAIKFTPEGGTITFAAKLQNHTFRLSISDNGIGIEQTKFDTLFDRDSSSHSKGTNEEKGSGLGLWICKVFTELNGGRIHVESEVGTGSTFILTFDADQMLDQESVA